MTPLYDTQKFYKKMSELQERLRQSEDERIKLEERFNSLSQDSRSRREACINNLRMRYIDFLEEQRLRDKRNHQILGSLDKIDGSLARMTARTDRLGILRKQYEAYLLRVYANRSTGGGTGDSGVGSHNEDRSPKSNILQTEKDPLPLHRTVTQNAGNQRSSSTPQTNHSHSYAGGTNISPFNQPRYTPGQETPQVHVMQPDGQGDRPTLMQPNRMPQHFYGSQNLNIPHVSASKTQQIPNASQELAPSRNYPQQFLRSNNPLAANSAHVYHHQLDDISNQYLENPRPSYTADPSTMLLRNLPNSRELISSDMQPSDLQPDRANARSGADLSADLTFDEAFGPHRHSTPLPGYLDYSTRYSRDPSVYEPNLNLHHGFTRSDLEKVIQRNEQILPRDYLHNPKTSRPTTMHSSKLSSLPKDKQKAVDAKVSRAMNDDELEQYIRRIRSLHRDNDQSLEALDIEQNTSGDLLNATLSDDAPDQPTLHSDDKIKPGMTKILSDDVKSVLALAEDFAAETIHLDDASQVKTYSSNDRKTPSKSDFRWEICKEDVLSKQTLAKSNDPSPAALNADMTSDNLSISAARGDILSRPASDSVNQIQDTSEIPNGKFRSEVTPLIADSDTSQLNITGAAPVSQNNPADRNEFSQNTRGKNEVPNLSESRSVPDKKVITEVRTRTDVRDSIPSVTKDHDLGPKETKVHEDIEGDKVSLIEGDQMPEEVIDVVRELQPVSLQHYEKNVVEIRGGDEDKNDTINRKVVQECITRSKIQDNEDNEAETLYQDSIANKTLSGLREERNKDLQHQDDVGSKYKLNSGDEYSATDEHLIQNVDENRGGSQIFEQNSDVDHYVRQPDEASSHLEHPYVPTSDETYGSQEIYHANRQYEADPIQVNAQESYPEFSHELNQHFQDDPNAQYAAGLNEQYGANSSEEYVPVLNEHYAANPNEQYTSDPNEQYAVDSNEQYATDPTAEYPADSNEHYAADPNERYPTDSNEYYATDTTEQYADNPNEQYGYYENQPYQNDPNGTYQTAGNEHYDYGADQGYQDDPNQQFENDPNQQYELDPNQQYELDPNQQYELDPNQQYELDPNQPYELDPNQQYEVDPTEHDPNEFSAQDPTQEYREHEYGQSQGYESAGYEEPEQGDNRQFENDSKQDYAGRNLELASSNQDYPTVAAEEENEMQVATGDLHIEESSDHNVIEAEAYSAKDKTKNKDVIKALLESDTESTIERNPSNNTESDFDFN